MAASGFRPSLVRVSGSAVGHVTPGAVPSAAGASTRVSETSGGSCVQVASSGAGECVVNIWLTFNWVKGSSMSDKATFGQNTGHHDCTQPKPKPGGQSVTDAVVHDLHMRREYGAKKYGQE